MSWDVVLLRFQGRAVVPFEVDDARRIVLSTEGARETEPGIAEVTSGGVADIHFGGDSPEILVSVFVSAPAVTTLIYEPMRELEMVVFFPLRDGWGAAVVAKTTAPELPDRSWAGWQDFDDDFEPPEPVRCRSAAELDAALGGPHDEWEDWAHNRR